MILASFVAAAYFYPILPDTIATHFNIYGNPTGYSPKDVGVVVFPVIILCVAMLLSLLPELRTPYNENIQKFIGFYDQFVIVICLFLLAIFVQVMWLNLGNYTDFFITLPVGLGVVLFSAGILCLHSRRNWFAGVRTPWTISDERVWDKTNHAAGRSLQIIGLLDIIIAIAAGNGLIFVVLSAILFAVLIVTYSYLEYRKLNGGKASAKDSAGHTAHRPTYRADVPNKPLRRSFRKKKIRAKRLKK